MLGKPKATIKRQNFLNHSFATALQTLIFFYFFFIFNDALWHFEEKNWFLQKYIYKKIKLLSL